MGSDLPIPPEEQKLKDDHIVHVQVSDVALIFSGELFHVGCCYFFLLKYHATGLNTIYLLTVQLLRKCKITGLIINETIFFVVKVWA